MSTNAAGFVNLHALEQLAKAATPGEWSEDGHFVVLDNPEAPPIARCWDQGWSTGIGDDGTGNAAFIAAANPQTVLALIARLRALGDVE